jgi:uncharacterized 2Fe-2S/4Fe-4S cluster protein (DUF4445 family)
VGFSVRFLPDDRTLVLDEPLELELAAARGNIWVEHPCGGTATCGRCRVRIVKGDAPPSADDLEVLTPAELSEGWRLGCRLTLAGPCEIEIPPQDRATPPKSFGPASLPAAELESQVPLHLTPPGGVPMGVAVDLGSTTLAAALVDLRDGRILTSVSCLNPQARFGADIMSRIHFAQVHPDGNARLHDAVCGAVAGLIEDLTTRSGITVDDVLAVTCVGNATMTHAAVGADVRPLGEAPYLGAFVAEQETAASALRWPAHRDARVRFAPMIRSHVGGDTVAGILACDVDRLTGWRLLVDLGTNAEVVVGCRERIVATSTAAGPAFDGANITSGMRAAPGAIDSIRIRPDGHLVLSTIEGRPAVGLCGSGLVDAVAELVKAGVIAPSGYMCGNQECEAVGMAARLRNRLVAMPNGERAVRLAGDVALTAGDVRQLQLAKGSIAAGIALLMERLGISAGDLVEIFVAGTFGAFIRKESLLAIGLLPPIDPQRVRFVGDAAGAGARMMLADGRSRRRAIGIAERCEYVELGGDLDYEAAFSAGLPFPEPERR